MDLIFKTCGETYDTLARFAQTIDLEGVLRARGHQRARNPVLHWG